MKEKLVGINISSRRNFFLQGGAALGAGVAAVAGAASLTPAAKAPDGTQPEALADREAIRRVQVAFMHRIESQDHEAATALFNEQAPLHLGDVSAEGQAAIGKLLAAQRWEAGCIEASFLKAGGQWKLAPLRCLTS
jgi:hypothetical protein